MSVSLVGLLVGAAILAPSLLLLVLPPVEGTDSLGGGGVLLTAAERAGQVGCLVAVAFLEPGAGVWGGALAACVAAYWALWVRYAVRGRHVAHLYDPVAGVPIPMAVLPVLAFGSAAVWGSSPWLGAAAVLLAAGHWPASRRHRGAVQGPPRRGRHA